MRDACIVISKQDAKRIVAFAILSVRKWDMTLFWSSEVERGIPPKKEMNLYVPLTDLQRTMYRDVLCEHYETLQGKKSRNHVRYVEQGHELLTFEVLCRSKPLDL